MNRLLHCGIGLLAILLIDCHAADRQPPPGAHAAGTRGGVLIVTYSADSADTFPAVRTDSILVLDWLRHACDSAKVNLEVKDYSFGGLIIGIGPRHAGTGGDWRYKVNGRMVPRAASSYLVSPSDTVHFSFK